MSSAVVFLSPQSLAEAVEETRTAHLPRLELRAAAANEHQPTLQGEVRPEKGALAGMVLAFDESGPRYGEQDESAEKWAARWVIDHACEWLAHSQVGPLLVDNRWQEPFAESYGEQVQWPENHIAVALRSTGGIPSELPKYLRLGE